MCGVHIEPQLTAEMGLQLYVVGRETMQHVQANNGRLTAYNSSSTATRRGNAAVLLELYAASPSLAQRCFPGAWLCCWSCIQRVVRRWFCAVSSAHGRAAGVVCRESSVVGSALFPRHAAVLLELYAASRPSLALRCFPGTWLCCWSCVRRESSVVGSALFPRRVAVLLELYTASRPSLALRCFPGAWLCCWSCVRRESSVVGSALFPRHVAVLLQLYAASRPSLAQTCCICWLDVVEPLKKGFVSG